MSITTIEDLSNEFFYEIFEYLYGHEIYNAFSMLNYRFQQLLTSSSLFYNVSISYSIFKGSNERAVKELLLNHKHQILSLNIYLPSKNNEFFSSSSIDSSFNHLESICLNELPAIMLTKLLTSLSSLPQLFSLYIDIENRLSDLTEVYQLVFSLPKLKHLTISTSNTALDGLSLPIATEDQFTTIEYFSIDHDCRLDELITLISYTPDLYHLKLMNLLESNSNDEIMIPISFPNLTHLLIESTYINFDEFSEFIIETECNLKVLKLSTYSYALDYLDSNQWEQLISNYINDLDEFDFECYQDIDPESGSWPDYKSVDQFNSSFWIERQWTFEVNMSSTDYVYSICKYKKRWYDVDDIFEFPKSNQLKLTYIDHDQCMSLFDLYIRDLLAISKIYHLNITIEHICSSMVMYLIDALPSLDTLKLTSLKMSNSDNTYVHQKNNISKVYLKKMYTIEELYFLMKLCPRMTFFKVDFINNMNIEVFIKDIVNKISKNSNKYLHSLCIHKSITNDEIIQKFADYNKITHDGDGDCFNLQWKLF